MIALLERAGLKAVPTGVAHGTVTAVSQVWETEPVGFADQANFLNAALRLETGLSVDQLNAVLFGLLIVLFPELVTWGAD